MIEKYIQALREYALSHDPSCADGESVLGMLYECHNENCPYDNDEIKADFNELYQKMNVMSLRDMDKVIYPVCKLCRDHEKAGFIEGIKVGIHLATEITLAKGCPALGHPCLFGGLTFSIKNSSIITEISGR